MEGWLLLQASGASLVKTPGVVDCHSTVGALHEFASPLLQIEPSLLLVPNTKGSERVVEKMIFLSLTWKR